MRLEIIRLIHPWSHEIKDVDVIAVMKTYVSIKWPMSGIYDLNLARNILTARSIKARNKGRCLWQAEDIAKVRTDVENHLRKFDLKALVNEQRAVHDANMPGGKK
jgi:hypothetical protein